MNTPKDTPEEKKELIEAFRAYDWIIVHTNPVALKLYLELSWYPMEIPPCIKERVEELKEQEITQADIENRNPHYKPRYFLPSVAINELLFKLVSKGIPLFKVDNRDISCLADIKRLWDASTLNSTIYGLSGFNAVVAYLQPQWLKIMSGLESEKQSRPVIKKINKLYYSWNEKNKLVLYSKKENQVELTKQESKLIPYLKKDLRTQEEIIEHVWEVHRNVDIRNKIRNLGELRHRINTKCRKIMVTDLISELADGYYRLNVDVEEK